MLMTLLARLPLSLLHRLGTLLGWAMYGLSPTYRRHLNENLAAAGYRDAAMRRAAIASAGQLLAELPAMWLRSREQLLSLVRRVEGAEHLENARASGAGMVLLTPHLGCFELAAHVLAEMFPITVLYRAPKIAWLEPLMLEGRGRGNVRLAHADVSGVRQLLRALQRHEAVGILPDQVPGRGEGEWADFFGRPAYTMTLAARLAQRPGTRWLLVLVERLPGGAGYVMHVRPVPPAAPGEPELRRMNRALEELIRQCPGQYLWGYNRYKQPAAGAAAPAAGSGTPEQP